MPIEILELEQSSKCDGLPPELRAKPACQFCQEERPCTWACLGMDSVLAGAMWLADEMLADFERAEAEAAAVAFVARRTNERY